MGPLENKIQVINSDVSGELPGRWCHVTLLSRKAAAARGGRGAERRWKTVSGGGGLWAERKQAGRPD